MSPLIRNRWCVMTGTLLVGLTLTASHAGDSVPPAEVKMPSWVLVQPGTEKPKTPRPVEPTCFVVNIGKVVGGTHIPIELELLNTSAIPVRILGGNSGCSPQGCLSAKNMRSCMIMPRATGRVSILYIPPNVKAGLAPQSINLDGHLYVGATTTFAVPYRIVGTVMPPGAGSELSSEF